jgi:hypothetical protein
MEPSVRVVMEKLSKPKTELKNVKVDLTKKDQLEELRKTSGNMWIDTVTEAAAVDREFRKVNTSNKKIQDKLQQNRKEASKIANDMRAAYKMLDETPPNYIDTYVDDISDMVNKTPVSNLANIFPK